MRHILFPTVSAADAFIAEMQQSGLASADTGSATVNRRSGMGGGMMESGMATSGMTGGLTSDSQMGDSMSDRDTYGAGGTAEDAGAGAVKGTGVGAAVGATAGILSTAGVIGATAATVATGGLALPVILGMTALGAGVGAAVGAAGGAAGVDETGAGGQRYASSYDVDDEHYDRMQASTGEGGRAVAVEDSVPQAELEAAVQRHGGHFV